MKRFNDVLPLSLLFTVVALAIAIFIDNFIELPWISVQTLTNVTTVLSSVILLAVGLKLYRKFSGTQAILDKQTVTVIKLMGILSGARFAARRVQGDGDSHASLINLKIDDYKSHIKRSNEAMPGMGFDFNSVNQYFGMSIISYLEQLQDIREDVYLPRSIARQLQDDFGIPAQASIDRDSVEGTYLEFGLMGHDWTDQLLWRTGDIIAVMGRMKEVYNSADSWLEKNNPEIYDTLNIDQ